MTKAMVNYVADAIRERETIQAVAAGFGTGVLKKRLAVGFYYR